jgi:hypothetical protein
MLLMLWCIRLLGAALYRLLRLVVSRFLLEHAARFGGIHRGLLVVTAVLCGKVEQLLLGHQYTPLLK